MGEGGGTCMLPLSVFEPIFMFVVKHDVKVRCSLNKMYRMFQK